MEHYTYASVLSASAFVGLLPFVDPREEEASAAKAGVKKISASKKRRPGFWSRFRRSES